MEGNQEIGILLSEISVIRHLYNTTTELQHGSFFIRLGWLENRREVRIYNVRPGYHQKQVVTN